MEVEKIDNYDAFLALKSVWNDLLAAGDTNTIFLTHEWIQAWWETFGQEHELFIIAVKSNDKITGIAPLMLTDIPGFLRRKKIVQFIGTPNADYSDFIGKDKSVIVDGVLSYFKEHPDDWTRLELSQIPGSSFSREAFEKAAAESGMKYRIKKIETVHLYKYEGTESDRPEFSLKQGSTFKRNRNFFKQHNGLNFERIRDTARIKKFLPYFFQCHVNRWKTLGLPGKFLNPKMREFHEKLVDYLSPLDRISYLVLNHGEVPLASLFAFDYGNAVFLYNIATESFYERRSPGIIILHFLTEHFVREGYHVIDFLRGEGSHKARFINQSSINYQYNIYNSSLAYWVSALYDRLKSLPFLRSIIGSQKAMIFRTRFSQYLRRQLESGLFGATKNIIRAILSLIFSYRRFIHYEPDSDFEIPDIPGIEVNIRQLGSENIEQIANFYNTQENSEKHSTIVERFQNGADCFAAFYNDWIISMAWGLYSDSAEKESGLKLSSEGNQVILSDAQTADLYCDMGIQARLMAYIFNTYKKRGIRVFGAVERNDRIQMQAVKMLNCRLIGSKIYLKLFGIRIT